MLVEFSLSFSRPTAPFYSAPFSPLRGLARKHRNANGNRVSCQTIRTVLPGRGGDRIYSQPRESIRIPRTYLSFCRAVPHPPTVPRPRNYDATLWIKRIKVVVEEVLYEEVVARRVWNWIAKRSSDYLIALRFFFLHEKGRAKNFVGETMKSNRNVACDISFFTSRFSEFDTLISSDINNDEE